MCVYKQVGEFESMPAKTLRTQTFVSFADRFDVVLLLTMRLPVMVEIMIMTIMLSSYAYGKGEEEASRFSLQVMRVWKCIT